MGQVVGKATIQVEAQPFLNLPRRNILDLFDAYYDVAECFGLTATELRDILSFALKEQLDCCGHDGDERMDSLSDELFRLFDDDQNSLVDAFEFLSAMALVSAMSSREKLEFVSGLYDFDDSDVLTVEEVTLALRAAMSGLKKVSGMCLPDEKAIDKLALGAFEEPLLVTTDASRTNGAITKKAFIQYGMHNPEISSWMKTFDDFDEVGDPDGQLGTAVEQAATLGPQALQNLSSGIATINSEASSQQPWREMILLSKPPDVPRERETASAPNANLELDWIHGCNTRGNGTRAFYSSRGKVLYPAGAIAIKLDKEENGSFSQAYFNEHTDYIACLTVHHNNENGDTLVATAQVGSRPTINVWSSITMQTSASLVGFHKTGVAKVDFSPSGNLLLSVGLDPMQSIAVYKWRDRQAVFTSHSTSQAVMDCRFLGSDCHFGLCGHNFVHFWQSEDNDNFAYERRRGVFGNVVKKQTMTCITHVKEFVVTGAYTGDLCVWEGRACVRVIQVGSSGSITCLHAIPFKKGSQGGLCASTSDGKIHIWNDRLESTATFSIASYGGLDQCIDSICWSPNEAKLLIGLQSGELFEMDGTDGTAIGTITNGHSSLEVWGLATHPTDENQVLTVGSDKTLRIWDAKDHSMKRMLVLDTPGSCASYSSDGSRIFVGLGMTESGGAQKEGAHLILRESDLSLLKEARHSKKTLSDCKCSSDGKIFAFGSQDHSIYIYDAQHRDYDLLAKARGHSAPITRLDFGCANGSHNACSIQSNSTSGEIMYWNLKGKKQTPSSQRNIDWETQSCVLGWSVQGAHNIDGSKVVALNASSRSQKQEMIATVDQRGSLRLFRYPAITANPLYRNYSGHSAMVGNVHFSRDDRWIFTVGGEDCCLFQWRCTADSVTRDEPERDAALDGNPNVADGVCLDTPPSLEIANRDGMDHIIEFEEVDQEAEVSTPIEPWRRTIVPPSDLPQENRSLPDSELQLEWIHGYSATKCRNNLRFTAEGALVYNVGRTLVKYDARQKKQSFHQEIRGEISCIAVHPRGGVCAVSHIGRNPRIHIVDCKTMTTITVLPSHHRRAVSSLKFDRQGKYLVSVGQDDHHTMVIHDWENGTVMSTTPTSRQKTFDVDFSPNGSGLIQCGVNTLCFWTWKNLHLNLQNADFGDKGKNQIFYSVGWDGTYPVIGTEDGYLYRFLGRSLEVAFKAHASAIHTIYSTNEGIATGSRDGVVKLWGPSLVCRLAVDMKELGSIQPSVKSVCWDNELERLLVGTSGNEIWELSAVDGSNLHHAGAPVIQGHFGSHSAGLSVSPRGRTYVTVGDDKTLRTWDLFEHKLLQRSTIEMASRAVAHSPDGAYLAVGFGAPKKQLATEIHGKVIVMREDNFAILVERRDSRKMITIIKWSGNGKLLAAGSWDNKVYIYNVDVNTESDYHLQLALASVIEQHNSYIAHLDFSSDSDSKYLQVNCGACELRFYEAQTGTHIAESSRLRDVTWESQTCTLGWPVQGVWSPYNDDATTTSVDCTLRALVAPSNVRTQVVASADNFGRIRLFRYPCISSVAQSKSYRGQCGPIAETRWVGGDSHLVTVGAQDQSVMVWRHDVDDEAVLDARLLQSASEAGREDNPLLLTGPPIAKKKRDGESVLARAARPWIRNLVEPSNMSRSPIPAIPEEELELETVHGLQTQYTVNTVLYNSHGDIVFPSSSIGVVYAQKNQSQKFFRGHDAAGQISAICASPGGRFVASGDCGHRPKVRVWDAQACTEVVVLPDFHRRGVSCIAFSPDNLKVVSIGSDNDNSICVCSSFSGEWHDARIQSISQGGVLRVLFASFTSYVHGTNKLVSGGKDHLTFWTIRGPKLLPTKGVFGSVGKAPQTMVCGASVGDKFVSGTPSGQLYVWLDRKLERIVKGHEKQINCMHSCKDKEVLVTGCDDGRVVIWSADKLERIKSFDLRTTCYGSLDRSVRSVAVGGSENEACVDGMTGIAKILVGTGSSEIYELSVLTGDALLLHEGHFSGEVCGLAFHPTNPDLYATSGEDGTIRVWSVKLKKTLRTTTVDSCTRAVCWSGDGQVLLVGCGGGKFLLMDAETMNITYERRDSNQAITDVRFSPDSKLFALASADHKIYICQYDKSTRYKLQAVAEKHNSTITSMDFSNDSYLIQSDSLESCEHICQNTDDGDCLSLPSQLKNSSWATHTCVFGWPVQGIWPSVKGAANMDAPVSADRSTDGRLLAVGTEEGRVKLYTYPAVSKNALCRSHTGHTGSVARCRFSCDGSMLATIGKTDRTILVWKVKRAHSDVHN